MAKVQFSDVTPPDKRSIRNIPIPNSGKRKQPIVLKPDAIPVIKKEIPIEPKISEKIPREDLVSSKISELSELSKEGPYEYYYPKDLKPKQNYQEYNPPAASKNISKPARKGGRFIFSGIAAILVFAFIFSMMTVFASATVVVKPKTQEVPVSMKVKASLDGSEGTVRYEVVKLDTSHTVSVPASGEEMVEEKSSGKIVIYNNFSTEPQRLIVRTRFESPEGLIYRIPESVTVPGKTTKDGVSVPGSIEAEVFADEPGDKYNIKKTDFTVPGFKNDELRYKGFYARSATDFSGGFIGKRKTVSDADKEGAMQQIETAIKDSLEKELQSKVSDGLALLPGAIVYEMKDLPQKDESSSAVIGKEATAYAIMLDGQSLSAQIAAQYLGDYPEWNGISAKVADFSMINVKNEILGIGEGSVDLDLEGKAKMEALVDTETLKARLSGLPKKETKAVIDAFPGIYSATTAIRPVWKQSFPEATKIKVEVYSD